MKMLKQLYSQKVERRLSGKITFVISIICIIQVGVVFLMYLYSYRERQEEIIENNMQILHQVNTYYVSGMIDDMDTVSTEIFYDKIFWERSEGISVNEDSQIYNILASQYHSTNDLTSIYLYSSASNKFYIMDEAAFNQIPVKSTESTLYTLNGSELQQMPWYIAAQDSDGLAVSLAEEIRHDHQDIICFSRYMKYPLKNNDYFFVISLNVGKSKLDTLCRQLNNEHEELMIFNEQQLIYDSGEQDVEVVQKLLQTSQLQGKLKFWFREKIGSEQYIVIGDASRENGWTMLKLIPEKEMTRDVQLQFLTNSIVIFGIFIVGIFCLSYIINRTMKPIEKLAQIMRHYKQGEAYEEPQLSSRTDEVGTLYSSFEKMNYRINDLIESEYRSQIREKQARLEALQAQLDPHFLYNTLQTVSGIAIENQIPSIEDINNSLSEILRYSLNNSKQLVEIREEVKIVEDYIRIQKYRFGDKLDLEIKLSEEVLGIRVPVFFLQLPVENAIKHGTAKTINTVHICIYDQIKDNRCLFHIENNGDEMSMERLREIENMLQGNDISQEQEYKPKGLHNLNERIRQQFGMEFGVSVGRRPGGGTRVVLAVPKGD